MEVKNLINYLRMNRFVSAVIDTMLKSKAAFGSKMQSHLLPLSTGTAFAKMLPVSIYYAGIKTAAYGALCRVDAELVSQR